MDHKIAEEVKHGSRGKRERKTVTWSENVASYYGSSGNGGGDDGGTVRLKIVLTKRQLKQMLSAINVDENKSLPLEQLLLGIRRRHGKRGDVAAAACRSRWRPALQSIPEEL